MKFSFLFVFDHRYFPCFASRRIHWIEVIPFQVGAKTNEAYPLLQHPHPQIRCPLEQLSFSNGCKLEQQNMSVTVNWKSRWQQANQTNEKQRQGGRKGARWRRKKISQPWRISLGRRTIKNKKVGGGGEGGTCYGSTKRQEFNKNIQLNCNVTYNKQAKRVMKKALEKTPWRGRERI